jgi:hypothetical protein
MLATLISLVLHAVGWTVIALFAIRLIGWYPRGCRQLFLGLALDVLALSVWHFPEAARGFGLPYWNAILGPTGLSPASPHLAVMTFVGAVLLEALALIVCVRAFVGACRAAEELRFSRRSATDREAANSASR